MSYFLRVSQTVEDSFNYLQQEFGKCKSKYENILKKIEVIYIPFDSHFFKKDDFDGPELTNYNNLENYLQSIDNDEINIGQIIDVYLLKDWSIEAFKNHRKKVPSKQKVESNLEPDIQDLEEDIEEDIENLDEDIEEDLEEYPEEDIEDSLNNELIERAKNLKDLKELAKKFNITLGSKTKKQDIIDVLKSHVN